ncbi:MAG: hypothetical protein CMF73_15225 [Maricaulis sp.]|nr:hypothetical protein [Maricaulis sp.]
MIQAIDAMPSTDNDMKRLTVFMAALAVAGCATTSPEPAAQDMAVAAVAPTRNALLADAISRELAHLARFDPDAVDTVAPELHALANAVMALNAPGDAVELPVAPEPVLTDLPPPPAAMADAPSLYHGVHLASYRRAETAQRGWDELVLEHGEMLAGLQARLSETDIAGQGTYLRLKAGPFDSAAEARAVCQQLMASGDYCAVVDFSGQPMADMARTAGE